MSEKKTQEGVKGLKLSQLDQARLDRYRAKIESLSEIERYAGNLMLDTVIDRGDVNALLVSLDCFEAGEVGDLDRVKQILEEQKAAMIDEHEAKRKAYEAPRVERLGPMPGSPPAAYDGFGFPVFGSHPTRDQLFGSHPTREEERESFARAIVLDLVRAGPMTLGHLAPFSAGLSADDVLVETAKRTMRFARALAREALP